MTGMIRTADLPERLVVPTPPEPSPAPSILALNGALADAMGFPEALRTAGVLTGTDPAPGHPPLAAAYAGHQFGGFVPQLGDGRAHLIWEAPGWEVQLKGSGRTPFSRGGDGRAWLGPVLREYLVSEAMHALGVPTTRALAACATGAEILREDGPLPGAVLARAAPSHLRVGSFQYFAVRDDTEALRLLLEVAAARHHPGADGPLGLLRAAIAAQAALVAKWMSLGFIHGVMNTDNAHVGGLTIDYGPCAFMDDYHPARGFSSIDRGGRYAYANQPGIAAWNMAQLATALLPLEADREGAIPAYQEAVDGFAPLYQAEWLRLFRAKLGLSTPEEGDRALIEGLLGAMAEGRADFANAFRGLADGTAALAFDDPAAFEAWRPDWQARRARDPLDADGAAGLMRAHSPAIIPRNHRIEQAIAAAVRGDPAPFEALHAALADPYAAAPEGYAAPPRPDEVVAATFCGT
ncbi:MAG: protein adenylyltransferase SelO [Hasllibacter sp.]